MVLDYNINKDVVIYINRIFNNLVISRKKLRYLLMYYICVYIKMVNI